jgi:hypothetical protein
VHFERSRNEKSCMEVRNAAFGSAYNKHETAPLCRKCCSCCSFPEQLQVALDYKWLHIAPTAPSSLGLPNPSRNLVVIVISIACDLECEKPLVIECSCPCEAYDKKLEADITKS